MRRQVNNIISVTVTFFKLCLLKLFHGSAMKFSLIERFSPNVVIEVNKGGRLTLGSKVRIHSGSKIKVRKGGSLKIGDMFVSIITV